MTASAVAALPRRAGAISPETAVLLLIAVSAALRLAAGWWTGLCYGESYYFAGARHPSLGYFDHPPLSLLLATLSLDLTGSVGRLVLRWPFIALFAGTTWLLFLLGRRLFGPWAGFCAALLMNLAPVFTLSVGGFLQPDGPLMFFWLACVLCLTHLLLDPVTARPLLWWTAAGATLGLGILSKYSAVLLVAGAGLFVLGRPRERRLLLRPGPYLALAVATALFTPVLVWNARNHWISFVWQGTRGLDEFQGIRLDWLLTNIGGQAAELLPWIWVALLVELWRSFGRRATAEQRFVACLAVVPIVLFTAFAAYNVTGRRHFHWGMPGYLLLFLPLGDTVYRQLQRGNALYRWGLRATVALSLLFMTLVTSHVATGWLNDYSAWLPAALAGDDDPSFECIDFAALEGAFAERGLLDRRDIFVFSDWWYRAGKVDYGLKGKLPVLAFANDPRSFAFFDRPERWLGKDGILVTTKAGVRDVRAHFGEYFSSITALGKVDVGRRGRPEVALYLYRCENLVRPYPLPYGPAGSVAGLPSGRAP